MLPDLLGDRSVTPLPVKLIEPTSLGAICLVKEEINSHDDFIHLFISEDICFVSFYNHSFRNIKSK